MEHKSNKTEAVMRLLTGKKVATNPSLGSNLKDEETAPKNIEPKVVEQPAVVQPEPQPQVVVQPEPQPQVVVQPEPQPQVVAQPEPQPQVVAQPEPQPQVVAQPEPQPQAVVQPEPKPQVVVQPEPQVVVQPSVVEIDVTGELITELMPQVLQRFNCCQCPICYADAVTEAGNRVPTIKVKINGKEDMKMVEKMKDQHRKDVMMTLVRLALERKPLPKHD
ncbi:MAG: hypothetical protein J6K17_12185 [Oscillospiraceae bacterium]|nr:hypothetical protein [Oscillospiraceae bacterium]